jgi:hypothetical protein
MTGKTEEGWDCDGNLIGGPYAPRFPHQDEYGGWSGPRHGWRCDSAGIGLGPLPPELAIPRARHLGDTGIRNGTITPRQI